VVVSVGSVTVTVLVLVLVLKLGLGLVVTGVVSVMGAGEAGGTVATEVVTVDVETDVDTEVLVVLAGLSTPQAMRSSDSAVSWSTIDEPSGPLS
jgi:hypothetical protein